MVAGALFIAVLFAALVMRIGLTILDVAGSAGGGQGNLPAANDPDR
jgi:hypothetical protein